MKYTAIAALALLALSGCHKGGDAAQRKDGTAQLAQTSTGALVAMAGRLVLPAVPGHPGAAYFTLINEGAADVTLTGISIEDTQSAMMHETSGGTMKALEAVKIPLHGSVMFAPGGKHVMVFGIEPNLARGSVAHATLATASGAKISVDLKITSAADDLPADGDHDMAGMKM